MSASWVHERLTSYLRSTGWVEPRQPGPAGGLWRHRDSGFGLPVPTLLTEGGLDWEQILIRLAEVEGTTADVVETRLSGRLVDIANLRAANDIVISDTIPYTAGVSLIRNSWQMFRSCATTSLGKKAHIGRYRRTADDIAQEARMGHTKRGSFIIPILMPVADMPSKRRPGERPFETLEEAPIEQETRRVMRTFAESLAAMDEVATTAEREPNADDVMDLVRAGVSQEFTSALARILAQPAINEFTASFEWAATAGGPPKTASSVGIPSAAAERVERLSKRLRNQAAQRGPEILTGPVLGVHSSDDDQGGVVTVQTVRNQRPAHVAVNVSRVRLYQALDWMRDRETVLVEGRVRRVSQGLQSDVYDGISPLRSHQLGGG